MAAWTPVKQPVDTANCRLDYSGVTYVVVCLECGEQFGPTFTNDDARRLATAHRNGSHVFCEVQMCVNRREATSPLCSNHTRKQVTPPVTVCGVESCRAPSHALSLCARHVSAYKRNRTDPETAPTADAHRARKAAEKAARDEARAARAAKKREICNHESGCLEFVHSHSQCEKHYKQTKYFARQAAKSATRRDTRVWVRIDDETRAARVANGERGCDFKDCTNALYALGMCSRCYSRERKLRIKAGAHDQG
jgi:hypothetical protein